MSNTNYVSQRRLSLFFNRLLNMFITRKEYNNNITHYDNRRIYTYNPNEVNSVNSYTLICDEILSPEEFSKSVWSIVSNGETYTFSPEITTQFSWLEEYKCYFCSFKTPFNYIESTQDIIEEFQCLIFPYAIGSITTPGAYITKENLSSYELPNKIININIGEVKTLDEKFIPNVFIKDQQKGTVNGVASLDENGKVPLEQLPDNIGSDGGLTEVFWKDVQDKPFYDTRRIIHYSYAENPNPVSFDCAALSYSFYKVSDLVPTKEELFNSKITINGSERDKFSQDNVFVETDQLLIVQYPNNGFAFCICNTTGTCNFSFMGYSLSFDVPEVGVYRVCLLGAGMSDIDAIEIVVDGELKALDLKYLPENMALGYDTRIRSYYSQVENPNPLQMDNEMVNISCYKISDLIPTRDAIFNNCKVTIDGEIYEFQESGIQIETDDFVYIGTNGANFNFIFTNKSGTLNFTYSGYPMSIECPEAGIYYQRRLNDGIPEGRTIEFLVGGELKQIDPKFIPADLDFDLDDYYTKVESDSRYAYKNDSYSKSETYSKNEIDNAISNINLSNYYTKHEIYTKGEINSNYYTKGEINSNYYTKGEITNKYYEKSNVYTKSEVDNKIRSAILSIDTTLASLVGNGVLE